MPYQFKQNGKETCMNLFQHCLTQTFI